MAPKTVLITGCSEGGIGDVLAREFRQRGLRVFASARNPKKMQHLISLGIETLRLDVVSKPSIEAAVAEVKAATDGHLDYLINAAGSSYIMPVLDSDLQMGRDLYEVNVFGVIALTQAFFPLLRASKGMVANVGSIVGTGPMAPYQVFYASSKAALHSIGDSMRNEFAPFNIRVVTIVSGGVKSNLFHNTAVNSVPQNSPYFPIREAIEKRTFLSGHKDMPGDEYARKVVGDLLNRPRPFIWRGAFATLIWFVWCFGWVGMLFHKRNSDRPPFRTLEFKSEQGLSNSRLLNPPAQGSFQPQSALARDYEQYNTNEPDS